MTLETPALSLRVLTVFSAGKLATKNMLVEIELRNDEASHDTKSISSWGKQAPGEGIPADDFGQPWKLRRGESYNDNDNG